MPGNGTRVRKRLETTVSASAIIGVFDCRHRRLLVLAPPCAVLRLLSTLSRLTHILQEAIRRIKVIIKL